MASGFMDGLRRGRDAAIAARSRQRPPAEIDTDQPAIGDEVWNDAGRPPEAEHEESKKLIAELVETVELLQGRVVELIGGTEPMAKVLRLPGVKTWLLQ